MKCTGTSYDWDHCRVEKMGCQGCYHYKMVGKENEDEQKISECSKNKSNGIPSRK